MYASLVHLSLSDATMLTFVAPILTGFSGAMFLKETISFRESFSGCRHPRLHLPWSLFTKCLVCSFFGVILIARPQFLFGSPKGDLSDSVTHGQRMQSVA
jgi:drug/metabolite transporter (DMT)-like permease